MDDYVKDRRLKWWQRPTWLAALAALIASVSFSALVMVTVRDSDALDAIEHQQKDVNELVLFVRELQAEPQGNGTRAAVDEIVRLLCESSDPARQEACDRLDN